MAITKSDALRILDICRVDREKSFHALDSETVLNLSDAMKATSYRAPTNRNGSATRYFHAYLVRLANRKG